MASCLSGFDLEYIIRTSLSSSSSSSRKARTPRKRPSQTYNEAAALLSTAFPSIFSITNKTNKQLRLPNQRTCFFDDPSELLLPFPVTERPGKVKPREVEYNGSWTYRPDSSLVGYEDDFDPESMLDEETEEGIDSIMGSLNFDIDYNACYGYPIGLRYNFGFGLRNGLEAGNVINMMNLEPESMNLIESGPKLLLKLNYEKVLEAWDRGSRLESPGSDIHTTSAIIDLFSKNGAARKLHVDRRPRSKGEPTPFEVQDSIPIIDYSLLTSGFATDRSKVVQDIGKACEDWGCFMLVNHGVPESLIQEVMDTSDKFFNMTNEEKLQFQTYGVLDPIRSGSGCNEVKQYKDRLWREFLRLIVHPNFNCPDKPQGLSEVASDYVKRARVVATELLKGVSESLGFEASYMNDELNLDAGFHLLAINNYPPVLDLDADISPGVMPHTDHGLITLLYENGVPGLEVMHDGKWVVMGGAPNAFFIIISDQLEIFSNGKYPSKLHRSVVKDERTRVSLVITSGSSLDTAVSPSSRLVDGEERLSRYLPMKYSDYLNFQVKNMQAGKLAIQEIQIRT